MVDVGTEIQPWPAPWWRWFAACAGGEFVGMAAAAGAAAMGASIVAEPSTVVEAALVIVLAVVGGTIEGLAVGVLQWRVFRSWLPALSPWRYVGGTVLLAAAFWLAGMLPSTLLSLGAAGDASSPEEPPWLAVIAVAALGGAVGGCAFGLVQGWALRRQVAHPWRWVRPNAVGWAAAVTVITVGASVVPAGLPPITLVLYGAVVGVLAGACVGAVTAQAIPALTVSLPRWNLVVVDLLLSPFHGLVSRSLLLVRFSGRRSGRTVTLPAQYAIRGRAITVYAAHADRKTWWRSFADEPIPVRCVVRGLRMRGSGTVVPVGTAEHAAAVADYRTRWPRVQIVEDAVMVRIRLDEAGA